MTTGTSFWDTDVWSLVLTLAILLGAMMLANTLRRTIKPLRRMMIPSSVIGGFIVLAVSFIYKQITGNPLVSVSTLEILTYHGLGLGFAAMALRPVRKVKAGGGAVGFNAGCTVVSGYLLQGFVGLVITVGLYFIVGGFPAAGLLLPMGYGQGPGQAYNWGHNYETIDYGSGLFANGTSFGLTIAAAGFIAASVGGIIYLNVMRRRGVFSGRTGDDYKEEYRIETFTGSNEVPLSESLDKLTIQLALVLISYAVAYLFMEGSDLIIQTGVLGDFGYNTVRSLIWGFNFLFGTVFALLVKRFMNFGRMKGFIKREYANDFMLSRISGFMFDMMVVASIAAIRLEAFAESEFVVPLLCICVIGAAATYLYLAFVTKKVFADYRDEAFLALYGMMTGTASTGVILLREADPKFVTPASDDLVYHQPWAIVFGFPMLLLLGYVARSLTWTFITLGLITLLFAGMELIIFRKYIFKKKK